MSKSADVVIPVSTLSADEDIASIDHQELMRNPSMNREVRNAKVMAVYCAFMLATDTSKQMTSYGMKYYNGGTYPLPQTEIVALAELLKFFVFLLLTCVSESGLGQIKISVWYAIPSVVYVANNNIFYLALNYTTPPVWNILIQLRVVLTALTYRVFFKRTVTPIQWTALAVLISAIVLSNCIGTNVDSRQGSSILVAVCLAVFGSVTSVIGTIVMEASLTVGLLSVIGHFFKMKYILNHLSCPPITLMESYFSIA